MAANEPLDRRRFLKSAGVAVGVAAAAGVMAGCGADEEASGAAPAAEAESVPGGFGNIINEIRDRGKITIATILKFPPEMYRDPVTNEPAGYDVEIMKMIAQDLEVELDLVDVEWEAILPGVAAGKYDTTLCGIVNKPSRLLTYEFTRGYVPYDQWLLVRADEPAATWHDLNQPGKKITAQIGASAEYRARDAFPEAEIVPLKVPEVMLEVEAGRADACLIEIYLAMPFASKHPNTKVLGYPDEAAGLLAREWGCIPVRKDEHSFLHYLDAWIGWYWERGTLPAMYDAIVGPTLRGEVTWEEG
ncbi:MAG: ABC transporter substrate-binding protein [Anaerolineae bacterium]|jgi:ABC-type amino acid transport substrate-binding protein